MGVLITPTMIGQVVISGLLAGSLYALVALGLGLIFGVMRVLNVAHGPLMMLGAYTTYWLFQWIGFNPYLSLLLSMPLLFLIGAVLQRFLVSRVVDAPELSSLLLTFGVSIALVNLAQLADFISVVTLSQIDLSANFGGVDTILKLFAQPRPGVPPAGITEWDYAFLRGLYRASYSPANQQRDIAARMVRDLAPR